MNRTGKPQQKRHDYPKRKSGERRKAKLTLEKSKKILKRIFLSEGEESKNKKD